MDPADRYRVDAMDVTAAGIGLARQQYAANVQTEVLRDAIDAESAAAKDLIETAMPPVSRPVGSLGHHLDVRA